MGWQLWVLFSCAAIALAFGLLLTWFVFQIYIPVSYEEPSKVVKIPYGSHADEIGRILKENGLIRSRHAFAWYARVSHVSTKLRAGKYRLSPAYPIRTMMVELQHASGILTRVTIPEGYTVWQIGQVLDDEGLMPKDQFVAYIRDGAKQDMLKKHPFLMKVPTDNIEGYLFPDTYLFSQGDTKQKMVDRFLTRFEAQILAEWKAAPEGKGSVRSRLSFHEAVTLASMVEKEAQGTREMPLIAGVFYHRLDLRMPFASDPTVIYAKGLSHQARVTYRDVAVASPYNTYIHVGLPPTPIASPGLDAFRAVLQPTKTYYLFFVADGTGGHKFTKTYADHLAVQKAAPTK